MSAPFSSSSAILARFPFEESVRKPNPMKRWNPLARASGKQVDLNNRVDALTSNKSWNRSVRSHQENNREFSIKDIPQAVNIRLGDLIIDEDIQRKLDEKHCYNTIGGDKFNPRYLQPIYAIKNSKGQYVSIDAQHSVTTVSALIDAGLFSDCEDWRELEYPAVIIETDDLSFARKAFGIVNGKGKKKQSQYDELRNSVFCVRIDKNTDDDRDVKWERKVSIAEKHDCYPIDGKEKTRKNSQLFGQPGTFTHISKFLDLSDQEVEIACSWHNKYFHYLPIDGSLWFIFGELCKGFAAKNETMSDEFLLELAAIIQCFGDLEQFHAIVHAAHSEHVEKRYGIKSGAGWQGSMIACVLMTVYEKLQGTETYPRELADRHRELFDFIPEEIRDYLGV